MSLRHKELLESRGELRQLGRGEVLFAQGAMPRSLFLVKSGLVKISCSTGAGRDVITELLFPGDICGVLCGLDNQVYPVSATCLTPVQVTEILREEFTALSREEDNLLSACSDICRTKMRFQRDMTVALAVERVEQRAARVLCMLAERMGRLTPAGVELHFPLSRQDFSELIGTALETGIRALSSLRRQGLIEEPGEHQLVITNRTALVQLAEEGL